MISQDGLKVENMICLKQIDEIIKERFFIPSYQRGYRWENRQVTELLDDIWEFSQEKDKKAKFYCLQPVVTKKKEDKWELIDGQQRLTTIYIILSYLKHEKYEIEFETRVKSKEFMEKINEDDESNIDFYFIGQAYKTIRMWFENKEKELMDIRDEFKSALCNLTKIIWYEVNDLTEPVDIFTRLNIGKIPLTNAELIKALFLSKSAVNSESNNEITRLRQLEIASEWDMIEYSLQNDEFWYFVNREKNDIQTRIELIFNAMAKKNKTNDEYYTFRYFNEKLEKNSVKEVWEEVKGYYLIFQDWFNDRRLYHLIGYLVSCGVKIEDLKSVAGSKSKREFISYINSEIKKKVKFNLFDLSYEGDYQKIKNVLLLFNIETILNMKGCNVRFSFESFKKEKWSIEHIHAQNSEGLTTNNQWISWIDNHRKSLERIDAKKHIHLVNKMKKYVDEGSIKEEEFNEIFKAVQNSLGMGFGDDVHSISNLALLDKDTNSSLNNSIFDVKRTIIINRDKEGYFIPPCTRNVFLKYYSKDTSQLHFWSIEDRKDYLNEIIDTLNKYLPDKTIGGL